MAAHLTSRDPLVRTLTDVETLEAVPLVDRDLPATTYELVARTAATCAEVPAWRYLPDPSDVATSTDLSYEQLLARVHQAAQVLGGLLSGRRAVTAVLAPTHPETPALVLGAQVAGTFCAVNHLLGVEQVAAIVRAAGAGVLVALGPSAGRDTWEKARAVAALLPELQLVQLGSDLPPAPGFPVWQDLLRGASAAPPRTLPGPFDLASYFHTGGTTGTPKLAAHTHRNQVVNAWMMNALGDGRDTRGMGILAGLPWFHVNAWMVTGLATFALGATAVVPGPDGYRDPRFYPAAWRIIERYQVAAMSGVPTVYGVLSQVPVDADITCLEHPFVGAAPLTDALAEAWLRHTGRPLLEGYGCTECTCTVTASPRSAAPRAGSQGLRLPYSELRLAGIEGDGMPAAGEPGRVLVRGPHVFAGYVQPDGSVLPATVEGWYDTGDLGRLDPDGWLRLTGRAKDLIIRGGHNIDPAMVADALERHPAVALAAAVGRPDAHAGEVPVAYVTLAPGASVAEGDLLAHARQSVPERAAVPKAVHVLPDLPMTAVGKVATVRLREDAAVRAVRELLQQDGVAVAAATGSTDAGGRVTVRVTVTGAERERADRLLRALPVRAEVVPS